VAVRFVLKHRLMPFVRLVHRDPFLVGPLAQPAGRSTKRQVYKTSTLMTMAAEETTTVRIRLADRERLQAIAKARHIAVIDVLGAALDSMERQEFLHGLNDDYRRLRANPDAWKAYQAERQEWDDLA
jgi:hypothetical protein